MKNVKLILIACILLLALFVTGCTDQQHVNDDQQSDSINTDLKNGVLKLKITDKPSELNITHAKIIISNVQVHKSNETNQDMEDNESDEEIENIDDFNDSFIADGNGPYTAEREEEIDFYGSAIGGIEPYNYTWNLGDGNELYGQNITYNYSTNGTYTINLTVKDNDSVSKADWYLTMATIGMNDEEDDPDDSSHAGWYLVVNESQEFDLIELKEKNITEILGENSLSVGKYTQIRLSIEKANITIINATGNPEIHEMMIPSSSIKLIKPFWIRENETTELTLDFDVNESVHQTGKNKFIMRPTIKIIEN